jgi:uncharacterized membrane protein YdfJ with MMPL/SSD domain
MDYEVFLLARMREEYDRTNSTREAVVSALGHTGRLVTSGALILGVSFLSLSTNPDLPVRMIATGLALGTSSTPSSCGPCSCRHSWRSWDAGTGGCSRRSPG